MTVLILPMMCDIVCNVWVWSWWIWYWGCMWHRLHAVVMFQQYVGQHWSLPYISAVCIHYCTRMLPINLKVVTPTADPSSWWSWQPSLVFEGCQIHGTDFIASIGNIAVDLSVPQHFNVAIIVFADVLQQNCFCHWQKVYFLSKNPSIDSLFLVKLGAASELPYLLLIYR